MRKPVKKAAALAIAAFLVSGASNWTEVTGNDIKNLLADKQVLYEDGSWTWIKKNGRTYYQDSGADKGRWGKWTIRKGQFCSNHGNGWWCGLLQKHEDGRIRFVGDNNRIWVSKKILDRE